LKNSEKNNQKPNDEIPLDLIREKDREKQCMHRSANVCKLVTSLLGWNDGMPIEICDKCWNSGTDTPESQQQRKEYADSVVDTVKVFIKDSFYDGVVMESMFKRHLKPKVAERYLLSICKKIGKDKSLKYAKIIDQRIEND
jgi:hypothetical protein